MEDKVNWNNITDTAKQDALNTDTDSIFWQWFFPGAEQREQFGQQVALQEMQNEWNSEPERLKRMKDAGINVNTAASGIAGSGASPSVATPPTTPSAGAAGVGAAAQGLGAVAGLADSAVNAYEKFSLTAVEKERRKSEMANLLASAFHNTWLGRAVAEMLPLQKENERADTFLKLANFSKARSEKKLFDERVKVETERITEIKNQATLLEKQGNLVEAEKLKVSAQTAQIQLENDKLQWDKDFREKWHFDNTKPVDNALIEAMAFEEGDALGAVETIGKSVETIAYDNQKGFNKAEIEDVYYKAFNNALGNADVAPYLKSIENAQYLFKVLVDLKYSSGGSFNSIVNRIISDFNRYMDNPDNGVRSPERVKNELKPKSPSD